MTNTQMGGMAGSTAHSATPTTTAKPSGRDRTFLAGSAVFVALAVLIFFGGSPYAIYTSTLVGIYGIVTVSQEWLFGRVGQISLGAAAMMLIGAYTTSYLSNESWAVFPIPLAVALVLGGVVGLIVGIPALRLTGLYLMLTTLSLQFIVSFLGESAQGTVHEAGYIVKVPQWGALVLSNSRPMFAITAAVLGLVLLALNGMYSGVPGRAWAAIRQNETGASTMGISVTRWKLAAYVGSSALTAVGGSLYAYQTGAVGYDTFSLDLSLALLIMVFVGGIGTKVGPLIGAAAIVTLPKILQQLSSVFASSDTVSAWLNTNEAFLSDAIYGGALLILLLFERDGLFGVVRRVYYLVIRMVHALLSLRRRGDVS